MVFPIYFMSNYMTHPIIFPFFKIAQRILYDFIFSYLQEIRLPDTKSRKTISYYIVSYNMFALHIKTFIHILNLNNANSGNQNYLHFDMRVLEF